MSGFTKMFNSILDSTVWYESDPVRIVWLTMMAMCDRYGCVDASVPGLAARARVPLEACEEALRRFQEPDPYSRTKDYEGRRIEVVDGGWRLLNYLKYRQKMNQEERREYLRVRQAEHRARKKNAASQQQVLTDVDAVDPDRHVGPHTDNQHIAEAEAEALRTPLTPLAGGRSRRADDRPRRLTAAEKRRANENAAIGGSTPCTHTPKHTSTGKCIQQTLADGRAAKGKLRHA